MAVLAVLGAVSAVCGPPAASVGHARHDSWIEINDPAFTAGTTYGIGGLAPPAAVLAAGRVPGPGGADGMLWSSPDGRSWQPAVGADTLAGPGDDWLRTIAVDGPRLVATGVADLHAVVFTSTDGGTTWRRHEGASFGGFGVQVAKNVLIVGDEVVATGIDGSSGAVWIGPAP